MSTEVVTGKDKEPSSKPMVGIVMGSISDLYCMKDAAKILEEFGVPYVFDIVSAHRTPDEMFEFAETASDKELKVIIAGAGGAAHLPGMLAAKTDLLVIGVPIQTSTMDGIDSLLSIAQMPKGVPVATVAINGASNAALLAIRALAVNNLELREKLRMYRQNMHDEVVETSRELHEKLEELRRNGFMNQMPPKN